MGGCAVGGCCKKSVERVNEPIYDNEAEMRLVGSPLHLEIQLLQKTPNAVQEEVNGVASVYLGLGPDRAANLTLRRRLGVAGPPFGGAGFIDPQRNLDQAAADMLPPPVHVTADFVRRAKLQEFQRCAEGVPSIYFWALQPIFDTKGRAVSVETLLRARNGSDSAPFEDVVCLLDPKESFDVHRVYGAWKAAEIVDFSLRTLKAFPVLQNLNSIGSNVRAMDLSVHSAVYQGVAEKISRLPEADRSLLRQKLTLEITEDQVHPQDFGSTLDAWRSHLGLRLSCDDVVGELARKALQQEHTNFHVTTSLAPILCYLDSVKVDMDWAGYTIFLAHPSYNSQPAVKAEVLRHARDEDVVYAPQGPGGPLRSTCVAYSLLLAEFTQWVFEILHLGKLICIELGVNRQDENILFALDKLVDLGLDIFGTHRASFRFQGGPTGAKAFEPTVLAAAAAVAQHPESCQAEPTKPELVRPKLSNHSCGACQDSPPDLD